LIMTSSKSALPLLISASTQVEIMELTRASGRGILERTTVQDRRRQGQ
jgi:hypothetical protein